MMHWYCWKILLKTSPKARKIHEMSFVAGDILTESSAIRRARVGLFYHTHDERFMNAIVVKTERFGPYEKMGDAIDQREISLVK
jgi:hypothetical protein